MSPRPFSPKCRAARACGRREERRREKETDSQSVSQKEKCVPSSIFTQCRAARACGRREERRRERGESQVDLENTGRKWKAFSLESIHRCVCVSQADLENTGRERKAFSVEFVHRCVSQIELTRPESNLGGLLQGERKSEESEAVVDCWSM